jgi:hypothetical protein
MAETQVPPTTFAYGEFKFKGLLNQVGRFLQAHPNHRYSEEELWTQVGDTFTEEENKKHKNITAKQAKAWAEKNRTKIHNAFFRKPLRPFYADRDKVYYQPHSEIALDFFSLCRCNPENYREVLESASPTIKSLSNFAVIHKIELSGNAKKRKREDIIRDIFKAAELPEEEEKTEENGFVSSKIAKDQHGDRLWPIEDILEECIHGKEIFYIVKWEGRKDITKIHSSQLEKCTHLLTKFYTRRSDKMNFSYFH